MTHSTLHVFRLLFAALLCLGIADAFAADAAAPEATAVMYHRFGEGDYPSTNIRIEQFEAHIEELKTGGYTVLPLSEIVAALKEKRTLPAKTVAITIDDAYLSVYTEAWPRLKAAGFPFTLFLSTEAVDRATSGAYARYMTWAQVREMKEAGVEIGHHTVTHLHMPGANDDKNRREITEAFAKLEKELGFRPTLFAYPYGEASSATADIVRKAKFEAAFGQHSGAMGAGADMFYLPRFALNEDYGDVDRFRLVASSRPLPIADFEPKEMTITKDTANPPAIGFSLTAEVKGLAAINCFVSGEGKVTAENLGGVRVEVRPTKPFAQGRTRLNCTLPGEGGRWYWFGHQFYLP